ncbi:mannosylphosphate transferase Mnn4 [Aspergillus sclerotialis]|uniref:Mannosylphosphate transferase Mnn4 n=1 Tax=Aspergillus sclerotialis TaxID=2070753 RepID=A0A3A2ZJQ8_9EURO|nr:mannosylphosphate transferase Mnn4 [Aspergillus sclerotialis]
MYPGGLVTLALSICSTGVFAFPSPLKDIAERSIDTKDSEPDILWEKYGLNTSAEYKYFHEPGRDDILGHYDIRFFNGTVSDEERAVTLTHMTRAYLNFFNENDLETWISHGTLLGWWWNGKILPWDWDIDTQVLDTTLIYLADHYNHTRVKYTGDETTLDREFLLDVNPWARQRVRGQGHNIIDARWIDIKTGLYIDITGLSKLNVSTPDVWECKNGHKYSTVDLYPLRRSMFEGVPASVPFQYDAILIEEYKDKALAATNFHNHTWYPDLKEWVMDDEETIASRDNQDPKDDRQYEK